MANGKGLFGAFQGVVDSVKSTVQDIKLPEVKMPEVKIPDIKIPNIFQGKKDEPESESLNVPADIVSVSVQSAIRIIYFMMNVDGEISLEENQRFDELN